MSVATRTARILITDDSVVVRRLVSDVLSNVPGIEVVGTAANGRIALQKIPQVRPDLVILDVEMPDMDGISTLIAIREEHPRLPVVMFSTLTERGAAITLEALMAGANDYVTKPANVGSVAEAIERVRAELVPRIYALCGIAPLGAPSDPPADEPRRRPLATRVAPTADPGRTAAPQPGPVGRTDLVVIGISTGGPNALADLVPALPADLPVPVVIVQHMPPMFTRLLAERLNARSGLHVAEAAGGEQLAPGQVWLAPGDRHLEVAVGRAGGIELVVHDGPRENSCRPAVDVLFRSAAALFGRGTLAVVMTGMGYDGLRGAEEIVGAGGRVLTQDQASSVVWGMPGAVTSAGLADAVLPLDQLGVEIVRRCSVGRAARSVAVTSSGPHL